MRLAKLLFSSWLLVLLASCTTDKEVKLQLILDSIVPLDSLSSGSGLVYAKPYYYIVGDDSPWLYKLSESMKSTEWVKLSEIDSIIGGRTPKALKADFECMESMNYNDKDYLVFLSSGSVKRTRDTAIIFCLTDEEVIAKKNIRPFLEKIKDMAAIPEEDEINLEGLAISESTAFLFHRGNISGNIIISLSKLSLFNYITNEDERIPAFDTYKFNLPELEGTRAGFSGACMMPGNTSIIFTASLERTSDVYNDGAIAGSYIGTIPLEGIASGEFNASLLMKDGEVLTKKLEGIAVHHSKDNKYHLLVVTDNDDGTSDLVKVQMIFDSN